MKRLFMKLKYFYNLSFILNKAEITCKITCTFHDV